MLDDDLECDENKYKWEVIISCSEEEEWCGEYAIMVLIRWGNI